MRAAVIRNGIVVNIIVVESLDVLPDLVDAGDAEIGHSWDGAQFTKPYKPAVPVHPRMTEEEKEALTLANSEMIATLFEMMTGGGPQ